MTDRFLIQTMQTWRFIQTLPILAFAALPTAGLAAAGDLETHKASYEVKLESLQTEGIPMDASGAMATQLTRDCQKWEYSQEMQFSLAVEGGQPIELHFRIDMLEGLDGRRMEFSGWQKRGAQEVAKLKGRATMNNDGYGGTAVFVRPDEAEWDLPSPTTLPVSAIRQLVGALTNGRADPQSIAFEVTGVSEVTRVVAGGSVSLNSIETKDAALIKGRSWLVDRAIYFEEIARNEPFMFETIQIHESGVVSKFWQDYKTMVLSGELVSLEKLPEPDC